MIQHQGPISGVAAHERGFVATAGYDNQVILWDERTRRPLGRAVHDHLANQCAFSPTGRWLVTASSDHTARLWELPTMRLAVVFGDHGDDVEMAAFHPRLPLVATASRDHIVRVFDLTGQLRHRFAGHGADALSVEFHGDDELVSSSDDGTVKCWSLAEDRLVRDHDLGGVQTDTIALAGDLIFAGTDDGEIVCLGGGGGGGRGGGGGGSGAARRTQAHLAGIKRLVWAAPYRRLASLSYDRTLKIWRVGAHGALTLEATTTLPPVVWPRSAAFASAQRLVFGTFGSSYATYDLERNTWDVDAALPTHGVNAVLAVPGAAPITVGDAGIVRQGGRTLAEAGSLCNFLVRAGTRVLTGGQSGAIFDAHTGRVVHQHRSPLNCAASWREADAHVVVVGAYTGEGLVLRVTADDVRFERAVILHDNAIKGVAVGGTTLMSVCATGAAAFWSLGDLTLRQGLPAAHDKIANGVAALGDDVFASVSRDLALRVWRGGLAERIATPHGHSIKCVAAAPERHVVATGGYDGTVALYDGEARRYTRVERPTIAGISSLCWDAAAGVFLASSYDGRVYEVQP